MSSRSDVVGAAIARRGNPDVDGELFVALWVSVASAMRQASVASREIAAVTRRSSARRTVVVVGIIGAETAVSPVADGVEQPVHIRHTNATSPRLRRYTIGP